MRCEIGEQQRIKQVKIKRKNKIVVADQVYSYVSEMKRNEIKWKKICVRYVSILYSILHLFHRDIYREKERTS